MNTYGKKTAMVLALGAALTLAAGGAATARGQGGPGHGKGPGFFGPELGLDFSKLDADGSGLVTVEDLQATAQARFSETDANGDGVLDAAEITARIEARIAERTAAGQAGNRPVPDARRIAWIADGMILRLDADGNGTISAAEATPDAERLARVIDRFDTDDDNALSQDELAAVAKPGHGPRFGPKGAPANN